MRTFQLLDNLEFHDDNAYAQPLLSNNEGRVLRFTLKPGQSVKEHQAPSSPVYIVVLKGRGLFAGPDGQEHLLGPNSLITFDAGEPHSLRADKEEVVCAVFLRGVPASAFAQ